VALPGASPPQFFTPGLHLFLSDRTVLGLGHGGLRSRPGVLVRGFWLPRSVASRESTTIWQDTP
jgi:hypothetical protein